MPKQSFGGGGGNGGTTARGLCCVGTHDRTDSLLHRGDAPAGAARGCSLHQAVTRQSADELAS